MDDKLADGFATHQIDILRVAAGSRQKVLDNLIELEADLTGRIATANTVNKAARVEALLKQTRGSIKAAYDTIAANQGKDLEGIARAAGKETSKIMGAAIGADIFSVAQSTNQLTALADHDVILGHSSRAWWKGQELALQNKFAQQMRLGIMAGETNEALIARVRGTAANGYKDGLMNIPRHQAEALVRSSAVSVGNHARLKTMEAMQDVNSGVQWVTTLETANKAKGRGTCIECMALSGLVWSLPDYKPVGHNKSFPGPSQHFSCRCTQVPVMRSWDELAGKKLPSVSGDEIQARIRKKMAARGDSPEKIEKLLARSRSSMDGQVPEGITFDDWLNRKSDPEIEKTLGPGRAKIWDRGRGNVRLTDMTDQSNRPLTIKQLEELANNGTPLPETKGVGVFNLPGSGTPAGKLTATEARAAAQVAEARAAQAAREATAAAEREAAAVARAARAERAAEAAKEATASAEAKLINPRETLRLAIPDRDLEEIAQHWAKEGDIKNRGLKSLYGSLTAKEKDLIMLRKLELAAPVNAPVAVAVEVRQAEAVLSRPAVLPPAPPRVKPVSASIKGTIPEAVKPSVDYGMNAIDRVHDDGALPKMVITDQPIAGIRKSDRGGYIRKGYDGEAIYIDAAAPHREFTVVHEYGHFLHHQVLDDPAAWGHLGDAAPEMAKLKKTLAATPGVKELKAMAKTQKSVIMADWKYYSDEREIFARAYSQWIATKTRDPILLAGLESDRIAFHGKFTQWTDEEFQPIAAAFDAVFAKKGWL